MDLWKDRLHRCMLMKQIQFERIYERVNLVFNLEPIKINVCIYSLMPLNKAEAANSVKANKSCGVMRQLMFCCYFSSGQKDRRRFYDELLQCKIRSLSGPISVVCFNSTNIVPVPE